MARKNLPVDFEAKIEKIMRDPKYRTLFDETKAIGEAALNTRSKFQYERTEKKSLQNQTIKLNKNEN